jgi:hypothetical protein
MRVAMGYTVHTLNDTANNTEIHDMNIIAYYINFRTMGTMLAMSPIGYMTYTFTSAAIALFTAL